MKIYTTIQNQRWLKKIQQMGYETVEKQDHQQAQVAVCGQEFIMQHWKNWENLELIHLMSAGYDRLSKSLLKNKKIAICNARGVYSIPIAEWVLCKILDILKQTRYFEQNQNQKQWNKNRELLELHGKTVGIIGMGSIGNEIAIRTKAFGCGVLGYSRSHKDHPAYDEVYTPEKWHGFLSACDILVVTLPLNDATFHFIDEKAFAHMKPSIIFINISRGKVVDESALIKALDQDRFLGVALDVFEQEPLPEDHPFWTHPKVFVSPHNSFISDQTDERLKALMMANLEAFIHHRPLKNQIMV